MPLVVLVVLAAAMTASIANAESSVASQFETVRTVAKPVERAAPTYPLGELRANRQGWVDLSYVVTTTGEVVDPIVVDSSGSIAFERSAMRAVEKFVYQPATVNGEPVQQCETKVRISFALDDPTGAVSRSFYNRYRRIEKALDKDDLEKAQRLIDEGFEAKHITMAENAWLWTASARLYGRQGDKDKQLVAIRRATTRRDWVDDKLYPNLLTVRTSLLLEKGLYAEAIVSFSALEKTGVSNEHTAMLERSISRIEDTINTDRIISVPAELEAEEDCADCQAKWRYKPLRREFRIANVEGKLDTIEFRCPWQRFVDGIEDSGVQIWEMPESWGSCTIFVFGEPGTTFDLYEVPSGYMSAN